jgi:hypothetical protein
MLPPVFGILGRLYIADRPRGRKDRPLGAAALPPREDETTSWRRDQL